MSFLKKYTFLDQYFHYMSFFILLLIINHSLFLKRQLSHRWVIELPPLKLVSLRNKKSSNLRVRLRVLFCESITKWVFAAFKEVSGRQCFHSCLSVMFRLENFVSLLVKVIIMNQLKSFYKAFSKIDIHTPFTPVLRQLLVMLLCNVFVEMASLINKLPD